VGRDFPEPDARTRSAATVVTAEISEPADTYRHSQEETPGRFLAQPSNASGEIGMEEVTERTRSTLTTSVVDKAFTHDYTSSHTQL
jgi:hypothetical protein